MNVCSDCNQTYRATAGHCRGGRYGGCCRSFESSKDFDHHRTGAFHDDSRRCLSDAELIEKGWTRVEHRWLSPQGARTMAAGKAAAGVRRDAGALAAVEVTQ
jgi:hypothetical protein